MDKTTEVQAEVDYGAKDLKKNYRKYLFRALWIAVFLHLLGVGSYWLTIYLQQEEEPTVMVRILKYSELGPPPSISDNLNAPAIAVSGPVVKPTIGIPVPVPDAEISPDQTIATQQELGEMGAEGDGTGGGTRIDPDFKIKEDEVKDLNLDDKAPEDFVAYEKEPAPVKQVQPVYPELAIRAGLEGTVVVRAWVDKEGKVRQVKILKSDSEILDKPALDAAMQWVFTPALQQKKPVSVWIAIPFRFRLKDAK